MTKAFKRCGMFNAIDGSEDNEIHVQDIENYDIGESSDEDEGLPDSESDDSSESEDELSSSESGEDSE